MTKLTILEKNDSAMKFVLDGVDSAFAAELRRVMMSEVPTMAIQYVDVHDNDSGLFDEVLIHRLGLIPFTFEEDEYNIPSECKCEGKGCGSCQVGIVLEKAGPGYVHAKDIKTTDEKVVPTDGNIIVVELVESQKIKVEGVASLGFGRDHAKHQAAVVGYQFYPKASTKGDVKKIVEMLPAGSVSVEGSSIQINDPINSNIVIHKLEKNPDANLHWDENKIIFYVESVCALTPERILKQALEILQKKAEKFAKEVDKLK